MNDISDFYIPAMGFAAVFGMTCVYMVMMMKSTIYQSLIRPTVKTYDDAMRAYRMPAPHPEMEGIKYGEELLVFNPEDEDDEDDDDGDIIVRA